MKEQIQEVIKELEKIEGGEIPNNIAHYIGDAILELMKAVREMEEKDNDSFHSS